MYHNRLLVMVELHMQGGFASLSIFINGSSMPIIEY